MSVEWLIALLPFLLLAACPLVMIWMMRGMGGRSADGEAKASEADVAEIARLRGRLARLEKDPSRSKDETATTR
ncbi:MAG: DUF2933 domain-containing protein [Gemmatimonadetes bacterium]|nr:DUF2933 domain-containing protein [Gemmatimonadota bacterium]